MSDNTYASSQGDEFDRDVYEGREDDLRLYEKGIALGKLKLWFMRDCTQDQRDKFFALFDLPPVDSLETQRFALGKIMLGQFSTRSGKDLSSLKAST